MNILLRYAVFWLATLVAAPLLQGQLSNNSSLSGQYHFVHLLFTAPLGSNVTNARNLGGTITFDGSGGYTYEGQIGSSNGAPTMDAGQGTYSVSSNAFVTLSNPIVNGVEINGRLGRNNEILLGSSTEQGDSYDLFVAIRAPLNEVTEFTLNGEYTGATLLFPDGLDFALTSALLSLSPNGGGMFTSVTARGHSVNQGDENREETIQAATYSLNADGSGTADFGDSSTLFFGDRNVFVSSTGAYLIGYSTEPGSREIFLAIRNFGEEATNADWQGDFWWAEIIADPELRDFKAGAGALRVDGMQTATLAERLRSNQAPFDFSGILPYRVDLNSKGLLDSPLNPDAINLGVGVPVGGEVNAAVGSQIGRLTVMSVAHGIFFAIRLPQLSGEGVFVNPLGVLNAASFAPPTFPISPGTLLSVFGSGLAGTTAEAGALPLPTNLGGVSATINGIPAPLLLTSPTLVQLQVPFSVSGDTATLAVSNNGNLSNAVDVPVAETSPGVFSLSQNGLGPGVITRPDFSVVNEANPASPGETVVIWVTGLGDVNPPLNDGAPGSADPLNLVEDPDVQVFFGAEQLTGEILFSGAAPGFVGLYQLNVRLPSSLVPGPNIPVLLQTGNACSDFVDIAIAF